MNEFPADIRAAAVAVVERGYDEGLIDAVERALMAERDASREKVAQFMLRNSFATGHGDTIDDLLGELEGALRGAKKNGYAPADFSLEKYGPPRKG